MSNNTIHSSSPNSNNSSSITHSSAQNNPIIHSTVNRNRSDKAFKWLQKNYDKITFYVSAVISFIASMAENKVYDSLTADLEENDKISLFIKATLLVACILIIILLCYISQFIKGKLEEHSDYSKFITKAYYETRDLSLVCQEKFQEICQNPTQGSVDQDLIKWLKDSIQATITSCYRFFCESFDTGRNLVDDINFEVTFMTISHIDGKITIPFSCNKEHRTPKSMLLRQQQPDIYDQTVTAEIYQEYQSSRKATFRVISDTSSSTGNQGGTNTYHFLYPNQSDRIKSSIVTPIISHHSELLGTIVVHCNQPGFFKDDDYLFWSNIMDAFSSEIGKYVLMMEYFRNNQQIY